MILRAGAHQLTSKIILTRPQAQWTKELKTEAYLSSLSLSWSEYVCTFKDTHPLTFLNIASWCSFSVELTSRLVLLEGTHLWTLGPGVFPRYSLKRDKAIEDSEVCYKAVSILQDALVLNAPVTDSLGIVLRCTPTSSSARRSTRIIKHKLHWWNVKIMFAQH